MLQCTPLDGPQKSGLTLKTRSMIAVDSGYRYFKSVHLQMDDEDKIKTMQTTMTLQKQTHEHRSTN